MFLLHFQIRANVIHLPARSPLFSRRATSPLQGAAHIRAHSELVKRGGEIAGNCKDIGSLKTPNATIILKTAVKEDQNGAAG